MSRYPYKQVILMRTDLKNTDGAPVPAGKLIAQGGHASSMWVALRLQELFVRAEKYPNKPLSRALEESFSDAEKAWLTGKFAKIVLAVGSEEELNSLVLQAREIGIEANIVTDSGATEFGGKPTVTCAGLGPDLSERIDVVTGHLKRLKNI